MRRKNSEKSEDVTWLSWFFSVTIWKERLLGLQKRVIDLPDNLRIATLTSWRDKERGLAVFAGVFLASLVITLVLIYGVGLSQAFLEESIEQTILIQKLNLNQLLNKEPQVGQMIQLYFSKCVMKLY